MNVPSTGKARFGFHSGGSLEVDPAKVSIGNSETAAIASHATVHIPLQGGRRRRDRLQMTVSIASRRPNRIASTANVSIDRTRNALTKIRSAPRIEDA